MAKDKGPAKGKEKDTKPAEKKVTIGSVACEAILAGKSNQEALDAVLAKFPEAKTKMSSINWYRNDLKRKGHKLPDLPRGRKPATKEKGDDLTK